VKFNREAFTQESILIRAQANNLMIGDGYMKLSEGRDSVSLPPEEGIDDKLPTALVQKGLNKTLPINDPGFKQLLTTNFGDQAAQGINPALPAPPPVQAQAVRIPMPAIEQRASRLPLTEHGRNLWDWLTGPGGLAQFAADPQPWTALRDFLIRHGVDAAQAPGEATNIMQATPAGRALFALHHQNTGGH
jgi:hypothetical protein